MHDQCSGVFEIHVFKIEISNAINLFYICISSTLPEKYFVNVFQLYLSCI